MKTPRVAVVGAGPVGGYFGGMLARAGAAVTLIGRSRHVDVWRRNGLFLESPNFQGTIPVQASTEFDAAQEAERTEIHAFNGFVVRRGTELGVPTPVKQTLLALVKLRERQFECAAGHPGD